ncbi:MAG: hypothetical protein IT280_12760 [Ignavibacteria bacterium]|nr:hypothetical protein [Ignavibacteria bacterium]
MKFRAARSAAFFNFLKYALVTSGAHPVQIARLILRPGNIQRNSPGKV